MAAARACRGVGRVGHGTPGSGFAAGWVSIHTPTTPAAQRPEKSDKSPEMGWTRTGDGSLMLPDQSSPGPQARADAAAVIAGIARSLSGGGNMAVESNPPATTSAPVAEGSLLGRGVALLTPILPIEAGWIAGVVAHLVPGANLDQTQIVAFMIAVSTSALTAAWKWLQGWQQHESLVAQGLAPPRKQAPTPKKATS